MSKFAEIVVGGIAVAAGAAIMILAPGASAASIALWKFAASTLITAGAGAALSGIGTLIAGSGSSPTAGIGIASRNPVTPWNVIYGRTVVGGAIVYINEWGDSDKFLDFVIVLACHPCLSVDAILFDKQIVQMSQSGLASDHISDSFSPLSQTLDIAHIDRTSGVVNCQLNADIPLLVAGDYISVFNISGTGAGLNGRFPVASVSTHNNSHGGITFTYLNGGLNFAIDNEGKVLTAWPDYGKKIHMEVLLGAQTSTFKGMISGTMVDADPTNIVSPSPYNPWTSEHVLNGRTCVFLRLHYNDTYFANGLPTISFLVRGKADIYDPRSSSYGYSENAALCIADYLSNTTFGFKAAYNTEIPTAPLISAANICDEAVALAAGGSEPRYALNGQLVLTEGRGSILQSMLTACGGRISYQGGQFIIYPAAWTGSSGPAPGLGQMTGPFDWKGISIRDLYNGVKGTFICPDNNWQPGDIPPYAQDSNHGYTTGAPWSATISYAIGVHVVYNNTGYVSIAANTNQPPDQHPESWAVAYEDVNLDADGGDRRWLDIQLPFTISAATAQRLCKIELMRRRQFQTATFRFNMAGYAMTVLDVVEITAPLIGWNAQQVEIMAHRFTLTKQGGAGGEEIPMLGTEIDVQVTDASVYDWSEQEELTAQGYQQPIINLLLPVAPTDLTLESDTSTTRVTLDGLADTILVRWVTPDDAYVTNGGRIEIRYQQWQAYSAGTLSVTNGSTSVTGNGTAFTPEMVGGDITINGITYEVATVASGTSLTLTSPYTAATGTQHYTVNFGDVWIGLPSVQPSVTQVNIVAVTEGLQYVVEIRSVNSGNFPSVWVEAGPITASGANAPLPLRPYADTYLFAPHGYGFGLKQVAGDTSEGPSIEIDGTPPVNVFSSVAAPVIDPYGVTSSFSGGTMPFGDQVCQVFGIDGGGQRTLGSNFMQYTILDQTGGDLSEVTFGVTFASGTTGYELFIGPDAENLIGQGPQTGTPASITFSSVAFGGYGPPDPRAVKFCARGKRLVHGGIAGTSVLSSTANTIIIVIPGASNVPTAGLWAGRYLMVVSKAGLPETQDFSLIPITGNDANNPCTLTVSSGMGGLAAANDVVMIMTKASAATLTSIVDSGFQGPFAPDGLDTSGVEIGNIVRILQDPTKAAIPGDSVRVTGNTPTGFSVTPFQRAPGVGTIFIVEEPSWLTGDITTSIMANALAPGGSPNHTPLASLSASGLEGYVALIELLVQDKYGNNSPETPDGFRMLYIQPEVGGLADGYYTITPGGGNAVVDLANGLNQRLVLSSTPVNIPDPIFTGGAIAAGSTFFLYLDQDATGGWPLPTFEGGVGGFVSTTESQIPSIGTPDTRTAIGFTFHGSYWVIDSVTAGSAIS